jgi:hypothetical protein
VAERMEKKASQMKKFFILGQVLLQQLQGWWTLAKLTGIAIGALVFVYTIVVTANNMTNNVAKLQLSMDSASAHITNLGTQISTIGVELKEDDRQSKLRDAQMATALVAIYGDTPNGKKIIELLKLKELTQSDAR